MSELTPEDKQRLREDEKARLEEPDKATGDIHPAKARQATIGCLIILAIVLVLAIISQLNL